MTTKPDAIKDTAHIRKAETRDLGAITAIYAEAVKKGTASFELTAPDLTEITARFEALTKAGYPYLVAEEDGNILGYAYAGAYRARPAYRWCVENSIYLDKKARGRGVGKKLLNALIEECEKTGFRQMIAVIGDSANLASITVHHACGFELIGTLRHVGWKHGKWLDTVYMQLPLGEGADNDPEADSLPGKMFTPVKTA